MPRLYIDNYVIDTPIIEIINDLQKVLTNGKLRDVKVHQNDIVVSCPHHSNGHEAVPDCNIYIGDDSSVKYGFARCFACDFQGPFEKFVAECFDSSVEYAKQWLIKNYGELAFEKINIGDFININKKPIKKYLDKSLLDGYQDWCPYLQQRKLNRAVCSQFQVKYDPKYRQILFPIFDEHDNLLMIPKRNIDTKVFYLDSGQDKPVYGLGMVKKQNIRSVIITEGPFDCLTSWSFGFPAIATLGTISDEQIETISKSGIEILYTMFDNDEAGRKFTNIVKKKLAKHILIVEVKFPQQYKDLNDLDEETFKKCLEGARNASYSF